MNNLLDLKTILEKYMSAIEVDRKSIVLNNNSIEDQENTMYCDIFPGVILAFLRFNSNFYIEDKINNSNVLEISYCIKGRFECEINNRVIYVSEGDLSVNHIGHIQSESLFPLKIYEGISIYIDIKKFEGELQEILKVLSVNVKGISEKLRLNNEYYICKATSKIKRIFSEIYENRFDVSYIRIKFFELIYSLKFLSNKDFNHDRYYPKEQVNKIKYIRNHMVEHD
ncbi:MAG TPA: hypothetical protein DG753_13545, partial [Clostridium sp.]|nr:hypothetical protein [Clostridium sp.]